MAPLSIGHRDAQVTICNCTIQRGFRKVLELRHWLKDKGFSRHGLVYLAFLKLKPTFFMVLNVQKSPFFDTAFQAWAKISSGKVHS